MTMEMKPENKNGQLKPFKISDHVLDDSKTLQQRMKQDGYLFFEALINWQYIIQARLDVLKFCSEAGWLDPNSVLIDGIARKGVKWTEPMSEYMTVYNQIMRCESFHGLAHNPELLFMFEKLFGEAPLPHPRNIARIIFPDNTLYTTPSHQDYIHIQGTEETYTAWIPLGDCPMEMGSLTVMPGSHRAGIMPVHKALGAGGVGIDTDGSGHEWAGSDFALGDVIIFHSLTVHKALPNLSKNRIRLSVDFRYQPISHPVAESSLLPHHGQVSWEEIYADWKSEKYKYFWKEHPLRLASQDPRVHAIRNAAMD